VETRRGRSGGSFVKAPSTDSPALDFRVIELRRHAERIYDAVEFREVLEPTAAAMAASKAKRSHVTRMHELLTKTVAAADDAEFMRWDTAFHLAIAEATGNKFVFESLERIRLELNPVMQLLPDTRVWHELSNEEHTQILSAIEAKDADAALQAMNAHILHSNQSVRTLIKSLSKR
jgi:DNA-binding FadR family transcriptional regulator